MWLLLGVWWTSYTFNQFYQFKTAVQNTSLQCSQQLSLQMAYQSPLQVLAVTLFSAAAHPQDGCLRQPQSSGEQNGNQSNAHQRCLHVASGAANCNTGKRRLTHHIIIQNYYAFMYVCGLSMCPFCIYLWVTKQCEIKVVWCTVHVRTVCKATTVYSGQ